MLKWKPSEKHFRQRCEKYPKNQGQRIEFVKCKI